MHYNEEDIFCEIISDYHYMAILRKMFLSPRGILSAPALPCARKGYLLKKWHQRRMRYIFEHFRDSDYLVDAEVDELDRSRKIINAILYTQEKIHAKINVIGIERVREVA